MINKLKLLLIVVALSFVTACSSTMRDSSYNSDKVGPDILEGSDTGTPSTTSGTSSGNSGPPSGR